MKIDVDCATSQAISQSENCNVVPAQAPVALTTLDSKEPEGGVGLLASEVGDLASPKLQAKSPTGKLTLQAWYTTRTFQPVHLDNRPQFPRITRQVHRVFFRCCAHGRFLWQ